MNEIEWEITDDLKNQARNTFIRNEFWRLSIRVDGMEWVYLEKTSLVSELAGTDVSYASEFLVSFKKY